MATARLTSAILADVPRERDVVSFSPGVDQRGRGFLIKFALKNGSEELVVLPPAAAFHVRDSIESAIKRRRYRDVRRREGDSRQQVGIIRDFLSAQPTIGSADWAGEAAVAIGCEVHGFADALFLGVQLTEEIYKILRLSPAICFYLAEAIVEAEKVGALIDLQRAKSPGGRPN
ncbi:MAG TPA: hypothetical protein VE914_17630 [Candidatus Angelobacter sp.]|nr:hypothetical protein [Candidatus Angelobacter sp.]